MANYYRITAYHPDKDISIIMDSYGMFEKRWQFSADLIQRGFKIIEVNNIEDIKEVNITPLQEPIKDKYILRSVQTGKPNYIDINIRGKTYKAINVDNKQYIPN